MSFAKLEEKIRADSTKDVARRANNMRSWLAEATEPQPEMELELQYLSRMATAIPRDQRRELEGEISGLQRRYEELMARPPAKRGGASSASSSPSRQGVGGDAAVGPIASFLHPGQGQGEDMVRLMSTEGRLMQEFQRYPILSVPATDSLLVFREVQAWTEEDDAEAERQQRRLAVLELSAAAANLREVQGLVEQRVTEDQAKLDDIERDVGEARRATSEAVVTLASARTDKERVLAWLVPSISLAILGGGIIAMAPAAAGGCIGCVLIRGSVTAGMLSLNAAGGYGLKKWQKKALQAMVAQLPKAFGELPALEVAVLRSAGDEAQRRLLSKLQDEKSWSRFFSVKGIWRGLQVFCRPSDVRAGGYAFSTSFTLQGCRARGAFQLIRQLSISGSLDPNCEVVWSRPVAFQAAAPSDALAGSGLTSLRYLVFSNLIFGSRDFYCVCRCAQVADDEALTFFETASPSAAAPAETREPRERFCFAVSSVAPELEMVASAGLPECNQGLEHGTIHISGIAVADDGSGGALVEVMADVNCSVGPLVQTWASDNAVRLHVLKTADCLRRKLRK